MSATIAFRVNSKPTEKPASKSPEKLHLWLISGLHMKTHKCAVAYTQRGGGGREGKEERKGGKGRERGREGKT